MGQEALCTVRVGKKTVRGKALLESEALILRGDLRLNIPLREMKLVKAVRGELHVEYPGGVASFELGALARKWAEKILHPKSLIDKLGVKPGAIVSVLGVRDTEFRRQLDGRTRQVSESKPRKDSDFIFFGAEHASDLARLKLLVPFLKSAGAIWVVYPKGQARVTEAGVIAAAKKAGLVDVKVARFSAAHTALKLVIPLAKR